MSNIIATIVDIKNCDSLNIVEFTFCNQSLSMMSLELNNKIKIGSKVRLSIKSTNIAISKDFISNISFENRLKCKILSIENGELLSSVTIEIGNTTLEVILTKQSVKNMNLNINDEVLAFINMSELSISEIIND